MAHALLERHDHETMAPKFIILEAGLTLVSGCIASRTLPLSAYLEAITTEGHPVAALEAQDLGVRNLRQVVDHPTERDPSILIVDTRERFLYLVQNDRKALRYGRGWP